MTALGISRTLRLAHGGQTRQALLYVPPTLTGAAPLIVALHGTFGRGDDAWQLAGLRELADREGVLLLAPQALGRAFTDGTHRNAGEDQDDVGFVEALVRNLEGDLPGGVTLDRQRVYLTGISSGASMAQRVMTEGQGLIAAAAVFGDGVYVPAPVAGVPRGALLLLWGERDPLSPPQGVTYTYPTGPLVKRPVADILADWAARYGAAPRAVPALGERAAWACANGHALESLTVPGLGHHWAGGTPTPFPEAVVGPYLRRPNFTALAWAFFQAQRGAGW